MSLAKSFTELKVWQEAHKLTLEIYKSTENFPKSESFGLTSQLRRSASSVAANITEGFARGSKREFAQFLTIARGSLAETQNHLLLARDLNYLHQAHFRQLADRSIKVHRLLNALRRSLKTSAPVH